MAAGVFLFTQNYQQDAVNTFSPYVFSQFIEFPVNQYSPVSQLDDFGLGVFGQGTFTFERKAGPRRRRASGLRRQERGSQDVL